MQIYIYERVGSSGIEGKEVYVWRKGDDDEKSMDEKCMDEKCIDKKWWEVYKWEVDGWEVYG